MQGKGFFYIICAGLMWGFVGPFSKLAFQEGVSPLEVAFWRAVLAWVLFGMHAFVTGQVKVKSKDIPAVIVFGVTGVALFYGSYQLAVEKGGAALASVLLYTAPAWVAVISAFVFKETMTRMKIIALGLTLLGVVGVSNGSTGFFAYPMVRLSALAVIFGLLSGFFYSLYYIFGKHFSNRYTSPNLFLYMLPIGALCLFPAVDFAHKTSTAWIAMACLAAISTYGAYYCYYIGLTYLEPSRAAITATIEPVVATVVAHLWWKESFTVTGYLGSVLILTAVILMVCEKTKVSRSVP